jgi:hypothetical protein
MINKMIMKKIIKKLIYVGLGLVFVSLYGCANDDEALQQSADGQTVATTTRADLISYTVENLVAGELETRLSEWVEDVSTVQSLKITGEFSKTDADYIKNNVTGLIVLDLKGVTQLKTEQYGYDEDDGGWAYRMVDTDELESQIFNGMSVEEIDLPESIIKTIGYEAFCNSKDLLSISIPNSVTSVRDRAFLSCSKLKTVYSLGSITELSVDMFGYCYELTDIVLTEKITSIGSYCFEYCNFESLTIPSSVTYIGGYVFMKNTNLKSINIQANIEEIPGNSFYECQSLSEVTLSESIQRVGSSAFYNTALTDFTPFENLNYETGTNQFEKCLFESVDLSHIDKIPASMFYNCTNLTDVKLSDSLISIGREAFGRTAITFIELPESLKEIGSSAFHDTHIGIFTVPESVTSVGEGFLSYCQNLVGVIWKSSVEVPRITYYSQWHTFLYLTTNSEGVAPAYNDCWKGGVIVDGVGDSIVLKSGNNPYACPQAFKAKKIYYSMDFNGNWDYTGYGTSRGWRTIALPFSPTKITHPDAGLLAPFGSEIEEDFKPFWLRDLTADGFVNVTKMEVNHPYIISMPYNPSIYLDEYNIRGTVTFEAENVEIQASEIGDNFEGVEGPGYTFYPIYRNQKKAGNIYALNTSNSVSGYNTGSVFARSLQEIYPFEGYVMSSSLRSVISLDGTRAVTRGASSTRAGVPGDPRLKQRGVPRVDDM